MYTLFNPVFVSLIVSLVFSILMSRVVVNDSWDCIAVEWMHIVHSLLLFVLLCIAVTAPILMPAQMVLIATMIILQQLPAYWLRTERLHWTPIDKCRETQHVLDVTHMFVSVLMMLTIFIGLVDKFYIR